MTRTPDIVVVGSANLDIVVPVPHHPVTGETVLGGDHRQVPGGKGANQATAVARLGRTVAFVGCVGDDDAGAALRRSLGDAGVDIASVTVDDHAPSGIAMIAVDQTGDNAIVVSPGANAQLTEERIRAHHDLIATAPALLLQLETPLPTVRLAAQIASGSVILNPAPAAELDDGLLQHVDVLVPNHLELVALAGGAQSPQTRSIEALVELAGRLPSPTVVITLGERGALAINNDSAELIAAPRVTPIDTTGAGDAFCAALADGLLRGPLDEAVRWAARVGAATTLRAGAAPSLPTPAEVDERLAAVDNKHR